MRWPPKQCCSPVADLLDGSSACVPRLPIPPLMLSLGTPRGVQLSQCHQESCVCSSESWQAALMNPGAAPERGVTSAPVPAAQAPVLAFDCCAC